jgi:hypothetical protein
MEILVSILSFCTGLSIGILLMYLLMSRAKSVGTIFITHDNEKTLYSLELDEYPESIAFKKKIVFKVNASEESLNRD